MSTKDGAKIYREFENSLKLFSIDKVAIPTDVDVLVEKLLKDIKDLDKKCPTKKLSALKKLKIGRGAGGKQEKFDKKIKSNIDAIRVKYNSLMVLTHFFGEKNFKKSIKEMGKIFLKYEEYGLVDEVDYMKKFTSLKEDNDVKKLITTIFDMFRRRTGDFMGTDDEYRQVVERFYDEFCKEMKPVVKNLTEFLRNVREVVKKEDNAKTNSFVRDKLKGFSREYRTIQSNIDMIIKFLNDIKIKGSGMMSERKMLISDLQELGKIFKVKYLPMIKEARSAILYDYMGGENRENIIEVEEACENLVAGTNKFIEAISSVKFNVDNQKSILNDLLNLCDDLYDYNNAARDKLASFSRSKKDEKVRRDFVAKKAKELRRPTVEMTNTWSEIERLDKDSYRLKEAATKYNKPSQRMLRFLKMVGKAGLKILNTYNETVKTINGTMSLMSGLSII